MTTKPHSNEEVIEQLFGKPCDEYEPGCATCEVYRILAQKDAEIADARREGMQFVSNALRDEYGDFLGGGIRVGRVLHKLGVLTPPDQTANPTN